MRLIDKFAAFFVIAIATLILAAMTIGVIALWKAVLY